MKILEGVFDPITQEELEYFLDYRKNNQIKDLYISVKEEGILPLNQRIELLKNSIRPYPHLHIYIGNQTKESIPSKYQETEEKVRNGNFYLACKGIRNILNEKGFYYENIAENLCNEHRYLHSISVAKTASKLAEMHNLDKNIAYRMGLLHDITKRWNDEQGEELLKIYYPKGLEYDPKVWHSFTCPFFIKKNLCITDQRILNAIWHHTLGDGCSDYDHILYIADKIEPLRGYDTSKEWDIASRSLKAAAHYVLEESKAYRNKTEGKQ